MSDEKTEEPSERKLEKANEDGSFPKSQEFCSALILGAVLTTVVWSGPAMMERFRSLIRIALDFEPHRMSPDDLRLKLDLIYIGALWLMAPVAIVASIAGTVGMVAQIGLQVSFKPLSPKLHNISPAKGIQKIFSLKAVLDLVQMVIRAVVVGAVAWFLIRSAISYFAAAGYQPLMLIGEAAWHLVIKLLASSLLCFLVMSGGDYALQRWQFMKSQKMSKSEVKREYKESEGDPQIKSARMQFARESARTASHGGVAHANVVLTNPTHYAVAIAYRPGVYDVPVVVARGADLDAKEIREQARKFGIPVFSNPSLTRALYVTPINTPVPREFFPVLSAVLIWLQRIEAIHRKQVGAADFPGDAA